MSIRVQCGACGSPYAVAEASLGKRMRCRKCGTVFVAEAAGATVAGERVAADDEYDVAAPEVAPGAPTAAPTTIRDARATTAAAAAAKAEQATPAWRKPGALVAIGMVAVGAAIVTVVLLNRPATDSVTTTEGGGAGTTPGMATTRAGAGNTAGRGAADTAAGSASDPSAADASEADIGHSSELFNVGTGGKRSPASPANPGAAPQPPTPSTGAHDKSPSSASPTVKSPATGAGGTPGVAKMPGSAAGKTAPATPPKTADTQSSPKPTKWLVRPDASKLRRGILSKELLLPVGDAEVIYPDQPSPFIVLVHGRDEGFEWELWNLEDGAKTYSFKSKDVLAEMIVSPDGVHAAGIVPGRVNDVEVWSLRQGSARKRFREAEGEDTLVPVCFVGDNTLVTTVAGTRKLTLWTITSGKPAGEVPIDRDLQFGGRFAQSPGGNYLAMFADTRLLIYSLATKELAGEVEVPPRGDASLDTAAGLTFSPDGLELAGLFGGRGDPVRVVAWDLKTGKVAADVVAADKPGERLPAGSAQAVRPVAWLADGTGWLLYGDVAVARAGGRTLYRRPAGDPGVRWRPADSDSFLAIDGAGAKRVLKATPVPAGPAS